MGAGFQQLFRGQMDFIFFFKGLAFLLLFIVTFLFRRDEEQVLPWRWLGFFGLAHGLAAWVSLAALNLEQNLALMVLSEGFQIFSWVALAEFGRRGLSRIRQRDTGLGLVALLLMLTALGGLKGWSGLGLLSRYSLGLIGGAWAAVILFLAGRQLRPGEQSGSLIAALSLGAFALTVALFPPVSLAGQESWLSEASFLRSLGVPVEFFQALLALALGAGVYGSLGWGRFKRDEQEERRRSRYFFALLTTLAVILAGGSLLTLYLGEWAQKRHERIRAEAQEFATIVVNWLNTEFRRLEERVISLAETPWLASALHDLDDHALERLNALLDRYRDNLNASVCYLMDRSGTTIASSNRDAPDSFVGKNYAFRPYFTQALAGKVGRYFAVGGTSKVPGYYVSHPVRDSRRKNVLAVAVIKVTLNNVAAELQAAAQKGNSLIALADPRGIVFLASHPDMIFQSLWPVADTDKESLKEQYGRDHYPALFSEKIKNGSKVTYKDSHYLASFAGTIHAGWSVYFFRPIELAGFYRLAGIAVACLLALLAMAVLGVNFAFRESALESAGRLRAVFDAAPEAITLVDPRTLEIVEVNRTFGLLVGYSPEELLSLRLDRLISHTFQEIQEQFRYLGEENPTRLIWWARKKNGTLMDLEVLASPVTPQGKDQVLLFWREAEHHPRIPFGPAPFALCGKGGVLCGQFPAPCRRRAAGTLVCASPGGRRRFRGDFRPGGQKTPQAPPGGHGESGKTQTRLSSPAQCLRPGALKGKRRTGSLRLSGMRALGRPFRRTWDPGEEGPEAAALLSPIRFRKHRRTRLRPPEDEGLRPETKFGSPKDQALLPPLGKLFPSPPQEPDIPRPHPL